MKQEATVCGVEKQWAVVEVTRRSACGGDCGSCKGCAHPEQIIRVRAGNEIGAQPGDRVQVETESREVFLSAAVAYILPLILMAGAYFLPLGSEGMKILSSFCGLGLGAAICYLYSKKIAKKSVIRAKIIKIFER